MVDKSDPLLELSTSFDKGQDLQTKEEKTNTMLDDLKRILVGDDLLNEKDIATFSLNYQRGIAHDVAGGSVARHAMQLAKRDSPVRNKKILEATYAGELGYDRFFRRIRDAENGVEGLFLSISGSKNNSLLPKGIDKRYKKWLENNPRPELVAENVIEDVTPDDVNYIDMAADKITAGDDGVMLSGVRDGDAPKTERIEAPHIDYVLDAVRGHYDVDGKINIYHAPENGKKDFDCSYKVIEFTEKENGQTHHIITNDWKGMMTAVVKDMGDFDPQDPARIDILELAHAGKAWTVRCVNEDQYKQKIIELCDTPIEDLTPQVPKVTWRDQKQGAIDAMRGVFTEMGQIPKGSELIRHGDLRGKGKKYADLFSALGRGAIDGLSDVMTKEALLDKVEELHPGTKEHANKATIDARKLFNDSVLVAENEGIPPQIGVVDELGYTLAGQNEGQLSYYFSQNESHGLTNLEDVLLPQFQNATPQNLDEFVVMTGIGVGRNGAIELAEGYGNTLDQS